MNDTTPTAKTLSRGDKRDGVAFAPDVRVRQVDGLNFAIEHLRANDKGVTRWAIIGYYGSFGAAVEALVTRHVHLLTSAEARDVRTVLAELERLRGHVAHVLGELGEVSP